MIPHHGEWSQADRVPAAPGDQRNDRSATPDRPRGGAASPWRRGHARRVGARARPTSAARPRPAPNRPADGLPPSLTTVLGSDRRSRRERPAGPGRLSQTGRRHRAGLGTSRRGVLDPRPARSSATAATPTPSRPALARADAGRPSRRGETDDSQRRPRLSSGVPVHGPRTADGRERRTVRATVYGPVTSATSRPSRPERTLCNGSGWPGTTRRPRSC
jgi:hypothetical protein